jgi:hypothetical protein
MRGGKEGGRLVRPNPEGRRRKPTGIPPRLAQKKGLADNGR